MSGRRSGKPAPYGSCISHVGIAVENLEKAVPLYTALTGMPPDHVEELPADKVRTAFFSAGESSIELLEAICPESPVARFIARRGHGGLHHICLAVRDIRARLAELKAAGVELIDETPRRGAGGKLVAFVHPKGTGGVLVELSQEASA